MTRKTAFFLRSGLGSGSMIWDWHLGTHLKFYTSLLKGLKLKVGKFWGLIPTFVEVTGEKLAEGTFLPPILNRVNKVVGLRPPTLLRKRLTLVFSCKFWKLFKNILFYRTSPDDCFCLGKMVQNTQEKDQFIFNARVAAIGGVWANFMQNWTYFSGCILHIKNQSCITNSNVTTMRRF